MERILDILIVEDDPITATRLTQELQRQGVLFRSRFVQRKEDFLRALSEARPDLILSDHTLSEFSGFTALDLVSRQCPDVPFIFVSSRCDPALMVEMFDSGAAGHVQKQHLMELGSVIRQALRQTEEKAADAAAGRSSGPAVLSTASPRPGAATESLQPTVPLQLCIHCRQVCNEEGGWELLESYLQRHDQATVTTAICPACAGTRQS